MGNETIGWRTHGVRSNRQRVVVTLDITPVEAPETIYWVDPIHPAPDTGQ